MSRFPSQNQLSRFALTICVALSTGSTVGTAEENKSYHLPVFLMLAHWTGGLFELAHHAKPDRQQVIYEALPKIYSALLPSASISFEFNRDLTNNRISKWFTNDLPDPLFLGQLGNPNFIPQYTTVPSLTSKSVAYLALNSLLVLHQHRVVKVSPDSLPLQAYAHTRAHIRMYEELGMIKKEKANIPRWNVEGAGLMEGKITKVFEKLMQVMSRDMPE